MQEAACRAWGWRHGKNRLLLSARRMAPELVELGLSAAFGGMTIPGYSPSKQKRPDCEAGLSEERQRAAEQAVAVWRDQYNAQLRSRKSAATIVFAAEYPNDMVSDLPTALHPAAELPLICHSIDAALTLNPNQIIIAAMAEHTEAITQVVQTAYSHLSCSLEFVSIEGPCSQPIAHAEKEQGPNPMIEMQRKAAAQVLAQDIPAVIELPCHWQIQGERLAAFAQKGEELLQDNFLAGCHLYPLQLDHVRCLRDVDYNEPNIIWGAAAWWKDRLQGLDPAIWQSSYLPSSTLSLHRDELSIITSRSSLAGFERKLRAAEVQRHQNAGVTFREQSNGSTPAVSACVKIGKDSVIGYGVQIYGKTTIGRCVSIEGPTVIKDSIIGDNVRIGAFSHLDHVTLASNSGVGPFARLRAGASIDSGAYIGNFCELKSAHVGQGGNVCHLSYLGDADVGDRANIGAGTITCNYNGVAKNRTSIAAGAFVGSNSTLVAPVTVGEGALIAAGSVITSDVPADGLALGRSRQTTKEHRAEATREKLRAEHDQKSAQRQ